MKHGAGLFARLFLSWKGRTPSKYYNFILTLFSILYLVFVAMYFHRFYFYLMLFAFAMIIFYHIYDRLIVFYLQKKGIYPKTGEENIESVHLLIKLGYKTLAMRCYMSVTNSDFDAARKYLDFIASDHQNRC